MNKRPFSGPWEYFIDATLFTSPPIENHSGAAVFNRRGELLGIGSLFVGDASGKGRPLLGNMFVPVDLLRPVLADLQRTGQSKPRPSFGLTSSESNGRVQVVRVNRDGPAESGGLRPGDVVLAVDGADVATLEQFYKKLWARPGQDAQVGLTVRQQGGEVRTLTLQPVDCMTAMAKPGGYEPRPFEPRLHFATRKGCSAALDPFPRERFQRLCHAYATSGPSPVRS